jgi:hypothetical protein
MNFQVLLFLLLRLLAETGDNLLDAAVSGAEITEEEGISEGTGREE